MNKITRFSLKNALAIIIIVVLIAAGGWYSASQLNRETMPDITIPIISVATPYPGAAPKDVYNDVTKPIETALRSVKGVKNVTAESDDSFSMVVAEFGYSDDMDKVGQNVNKALSGMTLPDMAVKSTVTRMSMSSGDVMKISITGAQADSAALAEKVKTQVLPALKTIDGVGKARIETDPKAHVKIVFNADKLRKKNLKVSDIIDQMKATTLSFPVGTVDLGSTAEPVRVSGTFDTIDDIKNFTIARYPTTSEMMGDAFSGLGKEFASLGQGIGSLGKGLGTLGQTTGRVAASTGMVDGLQQIQAQMVDLKIERSQMKTQITGVQKQIDALDAQIKALDPASPTYAQDRGALEAKKGPLSGQLTGLKKGLSGIETGISKMTAAANKLQKNIDKNNAALKKAQAAGANASSSMNMSSGSSSMSMKSGMDVKTIPLKDVATVTYGTDDTVVMSRANGKPSVLLAVKKTQEGNTVKVADGVKKKLKELAPRLGSDVKTTVLYDASTSINDSVSSMVREGLLGALFAVIIILIFLRNWRATAIVGLSIPVSIFTALLCMKFFNITLNVMTLGGLTVAIGRIVDDSIVVVENIFRHIQEGAERTPQMIEESTHEVSSAITSSTITTVAVFLPLGFVSGITGKIFMPFAITVTVALLASLLVAVALIPVLSKYFLLHAKVPKEKPTGRVGKWYEHILSWGLAHRGIMIGGAFVLFVASLALIPVIGTGFMPDTSDKYLDIKVAYPAGTKAPTVDTTVRKVEKVLDGYKEVAGYQSTVGLAADGSGATNKGSVYVKLGSVDNVAPLLARARRDMARTVKGIDGASVTVNKVEASGMGGGLEVTFTGENTNALKQASSGFKKEIADIKGIANLTDNLGQTRKQLDVTVNQAKAAEYGATTAMVLGTVQNRLSEQEAGTITLNDDATTVSYTTDDNRLATAREVGSLKMDTPTGDRIPISKIATITDVDTPISVLTKNGTQYASVAGEITASDSGAVISEVKKRLASYDLPAGVKANVGGEAEMMNESFTQMGIALTVAVFAVFLCLVLTFGEATAPFAILFALPLAVIGGLFGLWIAGLPLDMPALVGALMLIGIVVTNAVVFIDRVRQQQKKGLTRHEALMEAGRTRMRPILMTALTTIIALIPLASGFGQGSLISQSLAVIVLGGMTSSTLLTLLIVPALYDLLESWRDKWRAR